MRWAGLGVSVAALGTYYSCSVTGENLSEVLLSIFFLQSCCSTGVFLMTMGDLVFVSSFPSSPFLPLVILQYTIYNYYLPTHKQIPVYATTHQQSIDIPAIRLINQLDQQVDWYPSIHLHFQQTQVVPLLYITSHHSPLAPYLPKLCHLYVWRYFTALPKVMEIIGK